MTSVNNFLCKEYQLIIALPYLSPITRFRLNESYLQSSPEPAHYPKTVVVVVVDAAIVDEAGSGTAVYW